MVDFNNEATIGTPAGDVERISILQRRYDLIEAYESYKKARFQGANASLSISRARLISLFVELQASLERRFTSEVYKELREKIFSDSLEEPDFIEAVFTINRELDKMRLITIDTQKVYDSLDVEEENKIKGY